MTTGLDACAAALLWAASTAQASSGCFGCPGGTPEGEPCLEDLAQDVTNGGCLVEPPVFSPVPPGGGIICGTASTYDIDTDGDGVPETDQRDTDWYLFTQAELQSFDDDRDGYVRVNAEVRAEFPCVVFIIDVDGFGGSCDPIIVATGWGAPGCGAQIDASTLVSLADVPEGVAIFVSPGNMDGSGIFEGVECAPDGNGYTLLVFVQEAQQVLRECDDDPAGLGDIVAHQELAEQATNAFVSDEELVLTVTDSISSTQLPISGDIAAVRFYGLTLQYDDESGTFIGTCLEDTATPFEVSFYEDNGVQGDFEHGPLFETRRDLFPVVTDTGFGFVSFFEFTVPLVPPVTDPEDRIAWVRVVRETGQSVVNGADVDPCVFLWLNNDSALHGLEARQDGAAAPALTTDLTFCLGAPSCNGDVDDDGTVGTADLLDLLGMWGDNPGSLADLDGDGAVGTSDLLILLASWGPCA